MGKLTAENLQGRNDFGSNPVYTLLDVFTDGSISLGYILQLLISEKSQK
jgi:hypothetical protein